MLPPQRIASLISSATEMLFALGLGDQVVAVSHECDYPTAALEKPRATRSNIDSLRASRVIDAEVHDLAARGLPLYELDGELLASLAPELIVTQAQCDVCAVRYDDVLSLVRSRPELAKSQVLALNPGSLAEVLADVERLGEAAGCSSAARQYGASLRERVERIQSATESIPFQSRPRVACLEWLEPLMLAANWTPDLVRYAGGESGLARAGRHSEYGNWQDVLDYDPQVVIAMPCGFDLPRTLVEAAVLPHWPGWSGLSAVKHGRVFALDGNAYFNRSGPRLVDSLEILAHLLHPDLFDAPLDPAARFRAWQQM